jgi:hypothetical protein
VPVDDPRLELFLQEYVRDRNDSITLRGVHNNLTGLRRDHEREKRETRDRLKQVETKVDSIEKRDQTEDLADALADANGTGRHQTVPMQVFTPAFGTQVPMDLRQPAPPQQHEHKRDSGFWSSVRDKAKKSVGHAVGAAVGAAAYGIISVLSSHGCQPAQKIEAVSTTSEPRVPLPFPPEETTRPATPSSMPDAGPKR